MCRLIGERDKNNQKNNASDHIKKSLVHQTAVLRLTEEKQYEKQSTAACSSQTNALSIGAPRQTTLLLHIQRLNQVEKTQLTKKFQTAHHIATKAKAFNYYEELVKFNKNVNGVNLENGYLTRKSRAEIVHYLSQSAMLKKVTEPINGLEIRCYGVLNDRSSSAKTMDEHELFLVKSAPTGVPKFAVLSVEEVVEADHEGLGSFRMFRGKRPFITINRSDKKIGMSSDGARVNIAMHRVVKEQIGHHNMLVLCPNHKIKLAIHDAFDLYNLNTLSEINLANVYDLFRRANLRWRLFKRQAVFQVSFINVFF